jgi:hypothetical protein
MENETSRGLPGQAVTEEQARDRIYEFLKKEGNPNTKDHIISCLESAGIKEHPNLGKLYMFTGALGEFWVSARRGMVINHNSPPAFTITEAKEYAGRFLRDHVPEFEKRNFIRVYEEADGIYWKEEWEEEPASSSEKSIFQNWITITVNLERRMIHNFNFSDLRRVRFTEPKIKEEEARAMIQQRFPEGEIIDLDLMEHTSDGGVTWITIWNAVVKPDDDEDTPNRIITINADTGENVPL